MSTTWMNEHQGRNMIFGKRMKYNQSMMHRKDGLNSIKFEILHQENLEYPSSSFCVFLVSIKNLEPVILSTF